MKGIHMKIRVIISIAISVLPMVSYSYDLIDPVLEFKAPESLTEYLSGGLQSVTSKLKVDLKTDSHLQAMLQVIERDLYDLHQMYDAMVNTTVYNQIHRSDKQYLQGLIAKIDQLIDDLEQTAQGQIGTVRSMCFEFKSKIESC